MFGLIPTGNATLPLIIGAVSSETNFAPKKMLIITNIVNYSKMIKRFLMNRVVYEIYY